jgi:hypothetical protein
MMTDYQEDERNYKNEIHNFRNSFDMPEADWKKEMCNKYSTLEGYYKCIGLPQFPSENL